jgi:hypothetical protein
VEQELLTLPEHPGFQWGSCYSIFSFICMFYWSLFVLLSFFFWPLCCLFFFNIRILISPLVSSISSLVTLVTSLPTTISQSLTLWRVLHERFVCIN